MNFAKLTFVVAASAMLVAGCTHAAKTVSFKIVQPATPASEAEDTNKYKVKRGDTVFVDARPIEPLALPAYPTDVPKSAEDSATVVVKIVVGVEGTVEDIQRSMTDFSLPTPFARACFDAIKEAVARWKFEPAMIAVVTPQENGRPLILSSTPTDRPFEIAFTFSSAGRVGSEFSKR